MEKSKAFTHNSYFKNKILNLIAKPERRHLHCQNSLSDSHTPDMGYFNFKQLNQVSSLCVRGQMLGKIQIILTAGF